MSVDFSIYQIWIVKIQLKFKLEIGFELSLLREYLNNDSITPPRTEKQN